METTRCKTKASKFPDTAYTFYIKQYCKRKGTSATKYPNVLVEATQSWLSLTEAEKQQLNTAHKEQEKKFRLHFFDQLKNAEPFLKVKNISGQISEDLHESNSAIQESEEQVEEGWLQIDTGEPQVIDNNETINEDLLTDNVGQVLQDDQDLDEHCPNEPLRESRNVEELPRIPLVEPSPPSIKTSKDLFFMLNSVDGSNALNWTDLTSSQKSQYRRAVYLLKKDYINKFKEYLYSLSPKELFDYYHKTLFK